MGSPRALFMRPGGRGPRARKRYSRKTFSKFSEPDPACQSGKTFTSLGKCLLPLAGRIAHHQARLDLLVPAGRAAVDQLEQQAHALLAQELALAVDGGDGGAGEAAE